MDHKTKLAVGALALTALAGCVETGGTASVGGGTQFLAEQRCIEAVAVMTNPDVRVERATAMMSGEYEVILSVGGTSGPRAAWRCIGAPDGSTRAVSFLGSEGAA
ncbi:hypothetical protein HKCCSP123_04600 [Rhodobacterales bacterium HKCCSP123]|nr:hypothetical protein [Rhodobacterales bacterium HKCCSP123]